MTTAPFRWGLLGAARIARALIPAIRAAGGEVTALGVRDPSSERARAFSQEWNVPLVGGYQDVVDADVDAVYNPLPNDLHRPWTLAALGAGKHALTEKPLTLNAEEAQELADAARGSGRVLLEAFAYRFQPHITRVRALVAGGELGEIRAVRGAFGFHLSNPEDFRWHAGQGGGALYDVGTYPVNLTRLLLGEPHSVSARARWTDGGVDLGLSAALQYPGALASVDCAFDWGDDSTQRLTVVGTAGTLDVDGVFNSHTSQPVTLRLTTAAGERTESFPPFDAYAAMVGHLQRVARGEEAALYPPEDAVAQARVLDTLYASARAQESQINSQG
ncbi:Gfo/Idh/MocA family protein [Deinococcus hohokamensis]|uniref:Gfo/Idh/MocA family protein n=1 Tax=Deinococcus hohokamensis TaxID=309883 RepID=A0ABV9I9M6_9DEIO